MIEELKRMFGKWGAPKDAKVVSLEKIFEILKYEELKQGAKGQPMHGPERQPLIEMKDEYIDEVRKNIVNANLNDNIQIIELMDNKFPSKEQKETNSGCKILIKNLTIKVRQSQHKTFMFHWYYSRVMIFENNNFIGIPQKFKTSRGSSVQFKPEIDMKRYRNNEETEKLHEQNFQKRFELKFENNFFKNIRLNFIIRANTRINFGLYGNIFEEGHIYIDNSIMENYTPHHSRKHDYHFTTGRSVSMLFDIKEIENDIHECYDKKNNEIYNKILEKINTNPYSCQIGDLLLYMHYNSERIKIAPEQLEPFYNKASIEIKDNKIADIMFNIDARISFIGRNEIDKIDTGITNGTMPENKFNTLGRGIYWGPYQEVDRKGKHANDNKEFFIALKEIAMENNDKAQEIIINREILKCEHHSFAKEKNWRSLQDRAIMWFGKWSSDHGVSLARPVICLVGINFFIALIYYSFNIEIGKNFWHMFWEMFNPISNLAETAGVENGTKNSFVSFINVIQKVIYALLVYELIRVGRRFIAK